MQDIRHISLDFWHTMGEPNPEYEGARTAVLCAYYGLTASAARKGYKALKQRWEQTALHNGTVPSERVLMDQLNLGFHMNPTDGLEWPEFQRMLAELRVMFSALPPAIDQELLEVLRYARKWELFTLSVGSNTNFIVRGASIRELLPRDLFAFQLYSDEIGHCKPSQKFYSHAALLCGVHNVRLSAPEQILHVGDSIQCDVVAARRADMQAKLVERGSSAADIVRQLVRERERVHA